MNVKFNTMKEAARFRVIEDEEKYWVDDYWEKAVEIFTKDVEKTIEFIQNDCTDEEFFWLAEIFATLVEKTQCKKLIEVFKERLNKVDKNTYDQSKFESKHMREYVNYDEYIRSVKNEIEYSKCKLDDEIS